MKREHTEQPVQEHSADQAGQADEQDARGDVMRPGLTGDSAGSPAEAGVRSNPRRRRDTVAVGPQQHRALAVVFDGQDRATQARADDRRNRDVGR